MAMSDVLEAVNSEQSCCASCGMSDGMKLKLCTACKLVRYCSVKCQKKHRPQHKRACKERAAELHDEILFRQPESSHFGDCPICCLPHSIEGFEERVVSGCCSKMICSGCFYADNVRQSNGTLKVCLFCRHPLATSQEEAHKLLMKRVEANDSFALVQVLEEQYERRNFDAAFKLSKKAAELGDARAHFRLATMYSDGEGVEKNLKKTIRHYEQAAIAGHPYARHNLACAEHSFERAVKHFIIASKLGLNASMMMIRELYAEGKVSKEVFDETLLAHYAAKDATKSVQRSEAAAWERDRTQN